MARDLATAFEASGYTEMLRRVREARREAQERQQREEAEGIKPLRNWLMYPYAFECINERNVRKWTWLIFDRYERASWFEAEEAVAQAIYELACIKELRDAPRGDIGGHVYKFAIHIMQTELAVRAQRRLLSTNQMQEDHGDAPFGSATLVQPLDPPRMKAAAKQRAIDEEPLKPGQKWNRQLILEVIRDYNEKHQRPPSAKTCMTDPDLPAPATIGNFFDTFNECLIAAGCVPSSHGLRIHKWTHQEAARAIRSHRTYRGDWPTALEFNRSDHLPSASVMRRLLGCSPTRAALEAWIGRALDGSLDEVERLTKAQRELLQAAASNEGGVPLGRGKSRTAKALEAKGLGSYVPGRQIWVPEEGEVNIAARFEINEAGADELRADPAAQATAPKKARAVVAQESEDFDVEGELLDMAAFRARKEQQRGLPLNLIRRPISLPPMERVQSA